jgi:hypothetical protein
VKRVDSWQIFTVLMAMLVAAITLVVTFRDILPAWLFLSLTILFGVLLAGCFAWLMVITNPLQYFYTYIRKTSQSRSERKHREQQSQRQLRTILEWERKWIELVELIVPVMECDNEPEADQEEQYRTIRHWFIQNRSEVVPIWQTFQRDRTPMAHEKYGDEGLADFVLLRNWRDPFSFFYQPSSLWRLAVKLEVVQTLGTWKPSEDSVYQLRRVILILSDLVSEFITWSKRRD